MERLPLYRLSPCNCGHRNQGTRAKGGIAVRCTHCGTARRVPSARPTTGPDEPSALRPQRGRPLQQGNPWRYRPGENTRFPDEDRSPRAPAPTPERPARAVFQAPQDEFIPRPPFAPYRPCEHCAEQQHRTAAGTYPPASCRLSFHENGAHRLTADLCNPCARQAFTIPANRPNFTVTEIR